jgi:hypothetical protein
MCLQIPRFGKITRVPMHERRREDRHPSSSQVHVGSLERNDRPSSLRDVSQHGALITGRSKFSLGERVTVRFPMASRVVAGRVVRVSFDASDEKMFHYLTAVHFDLPLETLPT